MRGGAMTNPFRSILDARHEHFLTDASKGHGGRIDQRDRMDGL